MKLNKLENVMYTQCARYRDFFPWTITIQEDNLKRPRKISDFGVSKETIGFQGNKFVSFTFRIKQVTRRAYSNITKAHALQGSQLSW